MKLEFRALRADEIDVRVGQMAGDGSYVTLLLYKDARCDMNILDETVGAMNWQRHHSRENANCIVSIWDEEKETWIDKEDTGTESNTEKEKGLASDSFKRACVNWGIGRELYTSPFIYVSRKNSDGSENFKIVNKNGKLVFASGNNLKVDHMAVENGQITELSISNSFSGENGYVNKVVFDYPKIKKSEKKESGTNYTCVVCGRKVHESVATKSIAKYGVVLDGKECATAWLNKETQ